MGRIRPKCQNKEGQRMCEIAEPEPKRAKKIDREERQNEKSVQKTETELERAKRIKNKIK